MEFKETEEQLMECKSLGTRIDQVIDDFNEYFDGQAHIKAGPFDLSINIGGKVLDIRMPGVVGIGGRPLQNPSVSS